MIKERIYHDKFSVSASVSVSVSNSVNNKIETRNKINADITRRLRCKLFLLCACP